MCDNTQTSYKQRASNLYRMQPRQTKPYLMFAYYVQRSLKGLQLSPASHFLFPLVLSLSLCYNHSFLLPDRSNPRFPPPPSRLMKSTWPNKLAFYSTMSASPPPPCASYQPISAGCRQQCKFWWHNPSSAPLPCTRPQFVGPRPSSQLVLVAHSPLPSPQFA